MSSYQIDLTPTLESECRQSSSTSRPTTSTVMAPSRTTPPSRRGLRQAARRAVIGVDDHTVADIAARLAARDAQCRSLFRRPSPRGGLSTSMTTGSICGRGRPHAHSSPTSTVLTTLRGRHNAQNVMAAYAALDALGMPCARGCRGASNIPRPRPPSRIDRPSPQGRLFINDSKATNAESAAVALASFERDIFWILRRARQGRRPQPISHPISRASPGPT